MKRLEDMNLVDDFLAYSLTVHKTYGTEAARYILECILQRRIRHLTVVPQKSWYGETAGRHGVRLDIYLDEEDGEIFDVEPDNGSSSKEVAALPRRVRFYHPKIDAGNFAAGDDYSALRNVVVIFITTYDPFGLGRMVYTIGNRCLEVPELPYEDGARTVFLYTKGTEGDPPEEVRQLARYMEHSTAENARSSGLARLHQMVTEVKSDREVGLAYMKSYEIERRLKTEAKAESMASSLLMLLQDTREVSDEERDRILAETNLNVLDKWYQEALAQHRLRFTKSIAESKADSVLILLEDLGPVPEEAKQRILAETDLAVLDGWLRLAGRAESLEQFLEHSTQNRK